MRQGVPLAGWTLIVTVLVSESDGELAFVAVKATAKFPVVLGSGVHEKTPELLLKDAPEGTPEADRVMILWEMLGFESVYVTTKLTMLPAVTVCGPGTFTIGATLDPLIVKEITVERDRGPIVPMTVTLYVPFDPSQDRSEV